MDQLFLKSHFSHAVLPYFWLAKDGIHIPCRHFLTSIINTNCMGHLVIFRKDNFMIYMYNICPLNALVCANMDWSDKRKFFNIEKSKEPWRFRGKSLPLSYRINKNVWITAEIWTDWISDINREMCRKIRPVVPLAALTRWSQQIAATMEFLPPNTTYVVQPYDQEIIRNMK